MARGAAFLTLRQRYHAKLGNGILGYRGGTEVLSNADGDSKPSVTLAAEMARRMGVRLCPEVPSSQRAGQLFTQFTMEYLRDSFALLDHVRPGEWEWTIGTGIGDFAQYEHLAKLSDVLEANPDLKASLGSDYIIIPDIVVSRQPLADDAINSAGRLVDRSVSRLTPLRRRTEADRRLLHASVSCKWTLRSDRAQNARSEGLNLVRNRKGHLPHVVFVTMEPMPSRLTSIAFGTGDIDCCYHGALQELLEAADATRLDESRETLRVLVEGKRLRDISDLPLDLAV